MKAVGLLGLDVDTLQACGERFNGYICLEAIAKGGKDVQVHLLQVVCEVMGKVLTNLVILARPRIQRLLIALTLLAQ